MTEIPHKCSCPEPSEGLTAACGVCGGWFKSEPMRVSESLEASSSPDSVCPQGHPAFRTSPLSPSSPGWGWSCKYNCDGPYAKADRDAEPAGPVTISLFCDSCGAWRKAKFVGGDLMCSEPDCVMVLGSYERKVPPPDDVPSAEAQAVAIRYLRDIANEPAGGPYAQDFLDCDSVADYLDKLRVARGAGR